MANPLREHQHELLWPDGSSALLFGTEDTEYLTLTPPQIDGSEGGVIGDVDRAREDGRMFGEDTLSGKTYLFEIGVLTDRHGYADVHAANLDSIDRYETVWRSDRFRNASGRYGILRSNAAGVGVWRCYGRPRNFAEATGQFTSKGYTPITCEFALIDGSWYSDTKQVESVTIPPPENPGLIGPLKAPLSALPITTNYGAVNVGGSQATWPVVTIHGPVLNPRIDLGPLLIELNLSIKEDQSVTIDPRPWQRTVLRNDGATLAGAFSARSTLMRRMNLDPGNHMLKFDGIDGTGTSWVEVAWRDARSRP